MQLKHLPSKETEPHSRNIYTTERVRRPFAYQGCTINSPTVSKSLFQNECESVLSSTSTTTSRQGQGGSGGSDCGDSELLTVPMYHCQIHEDVLGFVGRAEGGTYVEAGLNDPLGGSTEISKSNLNPFAQEFTPCESSLWRPPNWNIKSFPEHVHRVANVPQRYSDTSHVSSCKHLFNGIGSPEWGAKPPHLQGGSKTAFLSHGASSKTALDNLNADNIWNQQLVFNDFPLHTTLPGLDEVLPRHCPSDSSWRTEHIRQPTHVSPGVIGDRNPRGACRATYKLPPEPVSCPRLSVPADDGLTSLFGQQQQQQGYDFSLFERLTEPFKRFS